MFLAGNVGGVFEANSNRNFAPGSSSPIVCAFLPLFHSFYPPSPSPSPSPSLSFAPIQLPPARTRSTPPTVAEQEQAQNQQFRFTPHKSVGPSSFMPGPPPRQPTYQMPMMGYQPRHSLVSVQPYATGMYPMPVRQRSASHFVPPVMTGYPPSQM